MLGIILIIVLIVLIISITEKVDSTNPNKKHSDKDCRDYALYLFHQGMITQQQKFDLSKMNKIDFISWLDSHNRIDDVPFSWSAELDLYNKYKNKRSNIEEGPHL